MARSVRFASMLNNFVFTSHHSQNQYPIVQLFSFGRLALVTDLNPVGSSVSPLINIGVILPPATWLTWTLINLYRTLISLHTIIGRAAIIVIISVAVDNCTANDTSNYPAKNSVTYLMTCLSRSACTKSTCKDYDRKQTGHCNFLQIDVHDITFLYYGTRRLTL